MAKNARATRSRSAATRFLALLLLGAALGLSFGGEAAANGSDHVITFENRCKEQLWLAEFGSTSIAPHDWALAPKCTQANAMNICSSGICHDGSCSCQSDADCAFGAPAGTPTAKCHTASGRCVKKIKISVPAGWSGRFWPRTGCSGSSTSFVCETGQCGPATGGNIDCTAQNATGNLATLFEIAAAGNGGADNFDVSLVSGYNVPVAVRVVQPADAPRWQADTAYAAGAQIVERVGKRAFGYTNGGSSGTSGSTRPAFPQTWTGTVADGSDISWVNTGPVCETSGCKRRGIRPAHCPSALKVSSPNGEYIACDAPANACSEAGADCAAGLPYYQCQNNGGEQDLFDKVLTLQSPNAATFVCFSAEDCPHGTSCQLNPTFADQGFSLPTGAGLCTPVAQNGGCGTGDDGEACPAINYPFVGYTCQTLSAQSENAQVCVPPVTSGMGDLWWNAANWTKGRSHRCTLNSDCRAAEKCLTAPAHQGLKQCAAGDGSCACWSPKTCTAATCPGANQCLNENGVPDGEPDGSATVDCATETCYCGPQGIYSGTCGPTNPAWQQAVASISEDGASWPQSFKEGCPVAYSYQFDDPSSNWSCTNPAQGLNTYRVIFCGSSGR